MTVADNTKGLTSNFPTVLGELVPDTGSHLMGSVDDLSRKGNDLGDDELSNGSGIGEGRVENGDTSLGSVLKVDLVRTDTETANDQELGVGVNHLGSDLGF